MADNDNTIIKPVQSLHSIGGLTPAKRRDERKRKQDLNKQHQQEPQEEPNESLDRENLSSKLTDNEEDPHSIDYCA